MTDIALDSNVARAIARILQSQFGESRRLDAVRHVLGDILMSAVNSERLPVDDAIRKELIKRFDAHGGIPNALIDVAVHDGVVELRGMIPSQQWRKQLSTVALATNGVAAVHDHLIWADPTSGAFMPSEEDSCPG
jgi:osmotically-inducible protein OsmY